MADKFPKSFGSYRLLAKIAQGGMAEIFLAEDAKGRTCALKRILPHLAHEENFIRMFIDEARIVSHIRHPNVAAIRDQGKHEGYYYMAMEFVDGPSLLALSERATSMRIALPYGLLAYIVGEMLAGLGCAHAARDAKDRHLGIVHRDVTPQNVIISYGGEVKLIDFGVAKARARLTQTEAGFTKGKLAYMSPEQARGEELDGRSDLFSAGIILYEVTTGTRLFNKEGPGGVLGAIVNDPIAPPGKKTKSYPRDLEWIVMRALEKEVDRRWQNAEEMREALLRFAQRERPQPGKSRLVDLVRDLFGAPEHGAAASRVEIPPTPASVEIFDSDVDVSVRVRGGRAMDTATDSDGDASRVRSMRSADDETRMMQSDTRASREMAVAPAVTSEGTPVLAALIDKAEDVEIPEPQKPFRVRAAHFAEGFLSDLELSWREHRGRHIATMAAVCLLAIAGVGYRAGLAGRAVAWLGGSLEEARRIKEQVGMTPSSIDAGFTPTILRIGSDPQGAVISVDGIGMGSVTPYDLADLPASRPIVVRLELSGYRTREEKITLWENQGLREMTLVLEQKFGALRVESTPSGASIAIDGSPTEKTTPATFDALHADRNVRLDLTLAGHLPEAREAAIADGETTNVRVDMRVDEAQIPPGKIAISSQPSGCAAWVDEVSAGTTPVRGFEAKEGPHIVRVRCENHREEMRSVVVSSGALRDVSVELEPDVFGYLTLRVIPSRDSEVRIHGKIVATPIEFLEVVPGRHEVVVENRSLHRSKSLSIDVGPNERVERTVNLLQ